MIAKKAMVAASVMLLGCCSTVLAQGPYQIKGKVNGMVNDSVYLYKIADNKDQLLQKVKMSNGTFTFKGKVKEPELYMIKLGSYRNTSKLFLIDKGNTSYTCDFDKEKGRATKITVEGNLHQDKLNEYVNTKTAFYEKIKPLYKEMQEGKDKLTEEQKKALEQKIESAYMEQQEYTNKAISSNSGNMVAPYIVLNEKRYESTLDELKAFYKDFSADIKKTSMAKEIATYISDLEKVSPGAAAPNFKMKTLEGKDFEFASLKGKIVVIDFWASWCGPCRKENPHMVTLYKDFHDKGLEMVGVSLDKSHDAWKGAVEKDGLTWTHVSDLQYWSNAVAKTYLVSSVPTTVLIGKDGKIVARGLRGDKLHEAVQKLLNE